MKYKWLNKADNSGLIVFFNGWGMDEQIVSNLNYPGFDVLMFYDYRSFEINEFDFSQYERKILIAWSMGVYVSNYFFEIFKNFDEFIAINGTQKPIDDSFGIPVMIYNLTVENFNELSCSKFVKKISPCLDINRYCTRSIPELKQELISIRDLKINNFYKFNKAIVSLKDRIIPSKNQLNWWQQQDILIKELDAPHYIFDLYKSWSDLL